MTFKSQFFTFLDFRDDQLTASRKGTKDCDLKRST